MAISTRVKNLLNKASTRFNISQLGTVIANIQALSGLTIARGNIIVGNSSGVGSALDANDSGKILVGDGFDVRSRSLSGDATLNANGTLTIAAGAVSASKVALSDGKALVGNAAGAAEEFSVGSSLSLIESSLRLAESLRAKLNAHAADATEHGTAADATNFPLTSATATSRATLITLVTEILTDFQAHLDDANLAAAWAFHNAQGTDHSLASVVAPTTIAECVARLNDIKAKFNLHDADAVAHTAGSVYQEDEADASAAIEAPKVMLWEGRFKIQTGRNDTAGSYNVGPVLPDNAIVKRAYYDVVTTFAGDGDDSSTIAITSGQGAGDIVSATAISAGGNVWDAGLHEGTQDGAMANAIKLTAARQPQVVVAINATDTLLAAGEMKIFIEYVVSI